MATYKVVLERPVYESAIVYVDADSESEAIENALNENPSDLDWDITEAGCGDADVVYVELENV